MSHNNYNNIKKYAAFIFMVFAVLSGSSDRIDDSTFIKAGKKAFVDILASNRLLIQDAKFSLNQQRIRSSIQDNNDFREFLYTNVEKISLNHIQANIFLLIVTIYYFNNIIQKNNIWKNAVF
jgi:hypothetical protein